jgi:hypothetical protein
MLSNLIIDARSASVVSQYLCHFSNKMVILQIPMTANTHDISAPHATSRMVRAADILMNTFTF